ncbi:MAG: sugar-binding protein, partial [Pricia sp.]
MKRNYFIFRVLTNLNNLRISLGLSLLLSLHMASAQEFSADRAADWDVFPVGNLLVSEVEDTASADSSALEITTEVSTENWYDALAQTFQNSTPATVNGDSYTVSFKHRAEAGRQIRVQIHGRPTDTYGSDDNTYYDEFVEVFEGYQDFSFTFVSNDTVPGTVHVQLYAGGDDTTFLIDNFDIENTGPGSADGDEPYEDTDKWNTYPENVLNEEIVTDDNALNGEAFRISPQTSIADLQWYDTGFQILQDAAAPEESGKSYKISFSYRAEADRQFRLSLLSRPLDTYGSDDTTYFGDFLQAGTEYQNFETTVTSSASVPSAIYIGFLVGGDDTAIFIDDIQIEEVVPDREPNTFYVSQDGDDSNSGTENTPQAAWKTIRYGLSQLIAGDVLLLNDGTYQENTLVLSGVNGDADTRTIVRSINKWGAKIESTAQYSAILKVENSSFIEIDGIEVFNNNNVPFEDWNPGVQVIRSNYVTVKNVYAHDCGCNGISGREGDYFTFENNVVRDNAKTNPYNCSGISVYQPINLDDKPGFHIIIRNNVAFENECRLPFEPGGFDIPTDGNGIILDDFNQTQSDGIPPYTAASLVENNLTFNNGGAGIKIYEVQNATVRNNTAWHNNYVLQEYSSGIGEIGLQAVNGEMNVSNNLVAKIFEQTGYGLFLQTKESGTAKFTNNIVVGSNSFEGNAPVLEGNITVSDNQQSFPKFANATTDVQFSDIDDFRAYFGLREGSPALDAANDDLASSVDLGGVPRPIGSTADVGAYEGVQEGTGPLTPDETLVANITRTITAINIDGKKDGAYIGSENAIIKKLNPGAISEENDLSATWTSLYDDDYLYVLVSVNDDDLRNDSDSADNDDSIELYLDGDNSRDSIYGTNDFIYSIGWNDGDALAELTKNDIEGVEAAVSEVDGGYIAEFAVPWSKLAVTPADSLRIGFD